MGSQHPDIIFVGSVDNPHYYMLVCNVGLVPSSFSGGLPLCIVEFFEHKVPVIASDLCGIPEVISPADSAPGGFLIEMKENSTPRIASLLWHMEQYVEQYVEHPALLEEHGASALAICQRFDMEQFVVSHEQLYTKVLSSIN